MRIDKYLSQNGYGTRKEVALMIEKGQVKINQQVVKKGKEDYDPDQDQLSVVPLDRTYLYLMLHKEAGLISASKDYRHKTVVDLLPDKYQEKGLFPVGRLDKDTEGLLLLTNDGALAQRLTHPSNQVEKVYFAEVAGQMTEGDREAMANGLTLDDGYQCLPAKLEILEASQGHSKIQLTITEGKYHQVKRMVAACGKEVTYLKRLSMGPLRLDPDLALGDYRLLTEEELASLRSI